MLQLAWLLSSHAQAVDAEGAVVRSYWLTPYVISAPLAESFSGYSVMARVHTRDH